MNVRALLEAVAAGDLSPAEAAERLAVLPYADLGDARADLHRELRTGVPEAVLAEGKGDAELAAICERVLAAAGRLLVTRLDPERAEALSTRLGTGSYHRRARLLTAGPAHPDASGEGAPGEGESPRATVVAAGTSDLPVAEEAALTLEWIGHRVATCWDVGIAGLHRLLDRLAELRRAEVLIAVAGMDGALPAVLAGLVPAPVIAVPTSVGYGVAAGGNAALHTMLASCAPGVAVVNIDNGFGAAVVAARILAGGGGERPDR